MQIGAVNVPLPIVVRAAELVPMGGETHIPLSSVPPFGPLSFPPNP